MADVPASWKATGGVDGAVVPGDDIKGPIPYGDGQHFGMHGYEPDVYGMTRRQAEQIIRSEDHYAHLTGFRVQDYEGIGRLERYKAGLHGFLNPNDPVAISFWIISIAMVASSVFFLWEGMSIKQSWKTSMNVGALVTIVAAVHYFYMREFWVIIGSSPILYRYIDWTITVPLQMIEFYLILLACNPNLSAGMFWRLLVGTVVMLAFGYMGEAGFVSAWTGFIVGMAGWGYILYEIFYGEAGQVAQMGKGMSKYVQSSFQTMRFIVTVGWSIYPLGYLFGYLLNTDNVVGQSPLNLIYNLADMVNKIAFCLAIWQAARQATLEGMSH
jgi:bacteriorhodopsin